MKYVLIDNAVVQCDDITNHIELDTSKLFENVEFRLFSEYEPIFNAIKTFLKSEVETCYLFVSTHYYFVPCFVIELQTYLGKNAHIIPIYKMAHSLNMIEFYDNYTIKTFYFDAAYHCTISKSDTIKRTIRVVDDIKNSFKYKCKKEDNSGLLKIKDIIDLNDIIDHLEFPLSLGDFNELIVGDDSFVNIIAGEGEFINFSPIGSLRYYDELMPRVYGFELFNTASMDEMPKAKYSYVIATLSGYISFNNWYQTWINIEKGGTFPIECQQYGKEKRIALMIPDSLIERNEIQIDGMYFGKFFVDMQSDYLGNLHLKIESLDGQSFFQTLQFAL